MRRNVPVLSVYNNKGRCIGYCGAHCYNARQPSELKPNIGHRPCECICGGRNHAAGLARAVKNVTNGIGTRPHDVQEFARLRNLDPSTLTVIDRTRIKQRKARAQALAVLLFTPPGPDDLFYGLAGGGEPSEGQQSAGGVQQRRE